MVSLSSLEWNKWYPHKDCEPFCYYFVSRLPDNGILFFFSPVERDGGNWCSLGSNALVAARGACVKLHLSWTARVWLGYLRFCRFSLFFGSFKDSKHQQVLPPRKTRLPFFFLLLLLLVSNYFSSAHLPGNSYVLLSHHAGFMSFFQIAWPVPKQLISSFFL